MLRLIGCMSLELLGLQLVHSLSVSIAAILLAFAISFVYGYTLKTNKGTSKLTPVYSAEENTKSVWLRQGIGHEYSTENAAYLAAEEIEQLH